MIIDIHGHYTAPRALEEWRNRQIAHRQPVAMPRAWS